MQLQVASATNPPQKQKSDPAMIERALNLVMEDGFVYELRTTGRPWVGFFNSREKALKAAIKLSGTFGIDGVFLTLNPVNPALLARTGGDDVRLGGKGTSAQDVLKRTSLGIDFDPVRPSGISTTSEEKVNSLERAQKVKTYLEDLGWGEPLVADSGNGTHLRYRIDLPNDLESRGLIDDVLKALSKFSDMKVKIDTTIGDAPRIFKLYGTLVAKGADTPDRPHRVCRVLEDGDRQVITAEQLRVVAALAPKKESASSASSASAKSTYTKTTKTGLVLHTKTFLRHAWTTDEVEGLLDAYCKEYSRFDYQSGWKWQIDCISDPSHQSPDAFICLTPDADGGFGSPTYSCSHDSCKAIDPKIYWTGFVKKLRDEQQDIIFNLPEDTLLPSATSATELIATEPTEPTDDDVDSIFHSEAEYDTAKPVTFAITGFLQEDAVTFIGGLSGHAKTLILMAMCKALLEGEPLFNHSAFSVPTPAEKIIYLIPESTLSPFKKRMALFGLEKWFRAKKFRFRTLSKDGDIDLTDPRVLKAVKGAHVFLDTAVRFMDGEEVCDSKTFAETVFKILKSGAKSVTAAHHSAKNFESKTFMSLENVLRGSGDLGALCATCWGVKQIDEKLNQVIVKNCKPRDFQPCEPFIIQGRPFINETGTFRVVAQDVPFDGKAHQYNAILFTNEMQTVLETYDLEKQKKLVTALTDHQKGFPNTAIAKKLDVSHTTIAKWLAEFDEKVTKEQKKTKGAL